MEGVRLYWCGMGTMPSATNTNPTMPVRRSIDRDLEMVAARGGEATASSSTADWPQAQGVMDSARAIPEKLWTEEESNMFPIHQRLAMTILSTVLLAGAAFAELKTYCFDSKPECQESQQAVKGGSVSGCYQYKPCSTVTTGTRRAGTQTSPSSTRWATPLLRTPTAKTCRQISGVARSMIRGDRSFKRYFSAPIPERNPRKHPWASQCRPPAMSAPPACSDGLP